MWFVLGITAHAAETWWPANDTANMSRHGRWVWTSHRYAAEQALATIDDGAALEFESDGRAVVLGLDTLTPPNHYGPPELGALEIFVDGKKMQTIRPREEDREVVIARSSTNERRRVRVVHRRDDNGGVGARIRGIRIVSESSGDLAFGVSGAHHGALVDVRAILTRNGSVVRDTLVRNWLNGFCRLAALPPGDGYSLELRAAGWTTRRAENVSISANVETKLPAFYLGREWDTPADDFKFPALGRPVVSQPDGSFRARFEANKAEIRGVRLVRNIGPAKISRPGNFTEDKSSAFYYHREGTIRLPFDTPAGLYDLDVSIADDEGVRSLMSRRSVFVVTRMPSNPVFFSFGHLDTWGQYQAEYLARLVAIANVVAPDLVLDSNEANPAYAAGALYGLDVPFLVNFGNHRGPEPGPWFGEPVGIVDFGREFTVLNFGRAWDTDVAEADKLLAARSATRTKIIHAFESNAPVTDFLDRHRIALIHYAHGPGPAVATLGATPTIRIGKVNSESFRVIRFEEGRPVSYTYRGHATAAIPFPRNGPLPIRVRYEPANDGTHRQMTARFENDLEETFPNARAVFVLPRGAYRAERGTIESAIDSDDATFTVVSVRFDLAAKERGVITVRPSGR